MAACYEKLRALPRRVRRALQRHFALPLTELALLLALWQGPAWAATIPVDGTTCTLVAAITAANTDAAAGGCPAGSGADTLVLPVGSTLTLTSVDNSTYGETGLPIVMSTITLAGQDSTLERGGGAPGFRLLAVGVGGELTVQSLTLRGGVGYGDGGGVYNTGSLTLINSTISGNSAPYGGGVFNAAGSLTLTNSTVSGNTADCGGGVYNTGTLTLINSTLSSNRASCSGGGIHNEGALTLVHSTLSDNAATYDGGGVYNRGTLTLANSILANNTANFGGGVSNILGTLTVTNSTLSGNTAQDDGGGVFNYGTLTLTNSTLSGNSAQDDGGGVYNRAALTLTNSTLSGNSSGDGGGVFNNYGALTLASTLVSGNTAASGAEIYNYDGQGTLTVDNFNLFGQNNTSGVVGFALGATDIVPPVGVYLSAILEPLAFNGGPTRTHNLASDSPALDALTAGDCPSTDQRGFVRPAGFPCDVGAVQAAASLPSEVTIPVAFVALPETFGSTTDPTGCAGGAVGKFFFQAQLTNQSVGLSLEALKAQVAELTNGNLLLTADGTPGGLGAVQTLPELEAFSDGVLEPAGTVTVPFVICLQSVTPFRFTVDLLGLEPGP